MNRSITRTARLLLSGTALLTGVFAGPQLAPADGPCTIPGPTGAPLAVNGAIHGILVETMENPPAHAAPGGDGPLSSGTYPQGLGIRLAQATEEGELLNGCGSLVGLAGAITVHAQSRIVLVTDAAGNPVINPVSGSPDLSVGPISGHFTINSIGLSGRIDGLLDFTLTNSTSKACMGGPCPFVLAQGTWSTAGKAGLSGQFAGVALVPFQNPAFDPMFGAGTWLYLDPTGTLPGIEIGHGATVSALGPGDFNRQFGTPAAKFVITMYQ